MVDHVGNLNVTDAMITKTSRLGPVMSVISVLGSLLLILMGFVFALDHTGAAMAYGVPLSGGSDNAWISSTAVRDLAFGCLALTFAILSDRRAMGLTLLFGAMIPIGDAIIVLRNSPAPLTYLPLHVGGAVGCWVLAFIFLDPLKRR
jgi:hypothetical protein